jgi:ABC-type lipoprotein release transport system permease subunit
VAALLYETSATDAATLAMVAALMLAVAALASLIPAQSSTRIDPVIALRSDA